MDITQERISFRGKIVSIQPRSNVWRYRLDNRTHTLTGYNLFLADGDGAFTIAISEKQYQKRLFRIGDVIRGTGWTKLHPKLEYADYDRCGALRLVEDSLDQTIREMIEGAALLTNKRRVSALKALGVLTVADALYFFAVKEPDAMLSIISTIRRTSVVVTFIGGAWVLKEGHIRDKAVVLVMMLAGVALLLGGSA